MPSEKSTNRCAKCGAGLLAPALGGLCPACLVEDSLESRAPTIKVNPVTLVEDDPLGLSAGDRIGRYKIIEEIGEGGFGAVYLAEQEEPVRRRVALKVIKLGMDTRQVIARFEAERQALALMDHPNIAKVLDGGATDTGRPYFVMELVRGIRITDYCDQNNLATRERLGLFNQVCLAIQHAHQKGIIHRDIKPSNILVTLQDGQPVPKVIDFGIAKATDQRLTEKTLHTGLNQFIGTPAYMSPEQAEMTGLDIDTRSDIYSLGVLLYELLTGKTPFDGKRLVEAGLNEIRRIIREEDPPRPSTRLSNLGADEQTTLARRRRLDSPKLISLMSGDLDWIVMKALEKDRTRRYETATGLASDIQRHLSNEPVLARPPSNLYRFQKLVRRNKVGMSAAGAVVATLILGFGISTWMFLKEHQARRRAVAAETTARNAASKSQQVAHFLKDMLRGVGPAVALGQDTKMLRGILDKTAERIGKDLTNQAEVEADLRITLARTYSDLGLPKPMEVMARRAMELSREHPGEDNRALAASLSLLGEALGQSGDFGEAEKCAREAVALHQSGPPAESDDLAEQLSVLGLVLEQAGKLPEAEATLRQAVAVKRRVSKGNADAELGTLLNNLGLVLWGEGKLADAEAAHREGLAIQRTLLGEHPATATSLDNLANVLNNRGEQVEAEALYREALAMLRKLVGEHQHLATALNTLGVFLYRQGKALEAEGLHREALAIQRKQLGVEDPQDAISLNLLAQVLADQGKSAEAESSFREALGIRVKRFGKEHYLVAQVQVNLGTFLADLGRLEEAETLQREALATNRKLLGTATPNIAFALNNLGVVLQKENKLADAEASIREALVIRQKLLGPESPWVALSLASLAGVLADEGRLAEAEDLHRQALAIRIKVLGPEHPAAASSLAGLSAVLRDQGKLTDAESVQRESLRIFRKVFGNEYLEVATALHHLVDLMVRQANFIEAEPLARECLTIREKKLPGDWRTFNTQSFLGACLLGQKKYDAAEPLLLSSSEGLKQRENKIPANQRRALREALDRTVRLYEETARPDQAVEWKTKLADFDKAEAERKAINAPNKTSK